jgi:hypothetical protein
LENESAARIRAALLVFCELVSDGHRGRRQKRNVPLRLHHRRRETQVPRLHHRGKKVLRLLDNRRQRYTKARNEKRVTRHRKTERTDRTVSLRHRKAPSDMTAILHHNATLRD